MSNDKNACRSWIGVVWQLPHSFKCQVWHPHGTHTRTVACACILQHDTTWFLIRRRASHLFRVTNQLLTWFAHSNTVSLTHESYTIRCTWFQRRCDRLCDWSCCRDRDWGWFRIARLVYIFPFQSIRYGCVCEGLKLDGNVHLVVSWERREVGN